jgi:hypothetical protein
MMHDKLATPVVKERSRPKLAVATALFLLVICVASARMREP